MPEQLVPVLLMLAVIGVGVSVKLAIEAFRNRAWAQVARELGLTFHGGRFGKQSLSGSLGSHRLEVRVEHRGKQGSFTVCRLRGGIATPIGLSRAGVQASFAKLLGGQDLVVGDPRFDDQVRVQGDASLATVLLDSRTRELTLSELDVEGTVVKDGEIRRELRGVPWGADTLRRFIRGLDRMLELADALAPPGERAAERLAATAAADPVPLVRLAALRQLQELEPDGEATRAASRQALGDRDAEVCLQGALFVGAEGDDVASAIAQSDYYPGVMRVRALAHVTRDPGDRALALLVTALGWSEPLLREHAAWRLGDLRHAPSIPRLEAIAAQASLPAVAAAAAVALGTIGGAEAERALVALLAHDEDDVKTSAATALGCFASVGAVEPLLAHAGGRLAVSRLARSARDAVAAIQARQPGAGAGQLAVVEPGSAGGGLSLEGEGRGGLSVEDEGETT